MIPDLNIRASVVRVITLDGNIVSVDDDEAGGEKFMCSLDPPTRSKENDGSPRDGLPFVIRWRAGLLGPQAVPQAGWRVSLTRVVGLRAYENRIYELLGDPREFRLGPETTGLQANTLPVGVLYPYTATLKEQGGATVNVLSFALWSERESHDTTGQYEDLSGEAPPEYADALRPNRYLDLGEQRYRIRSSVVDIEGPRVKFEARRSGA